MLKLRLFILIVLVSSGFFAQSQLRIEPPFWYAGFESETLQLLVHYETIGEVTSVEVDAKHVKLIKLHKAESPNYLFIDLRVPNSASAEDFKIHFNWEDGQTRSSTYQLKAKQQVSEKVQGFDSSDAIYLITPDRFANADLSNDSFDNLREIGVDRSDDYARHGGDIKGITNHLDYIEQLGFTSIWPTPMLENNMFEASYHGYAITDYYKVDPRFGTLEDYETLARELQKRGMKLIMDMVVNHCGREHWWMKDLPFSNWVNYQESFERGDEVQVSNHRRTTNQDAYASKYDADLMTQGWFVQTMPDLNQRNPFLATYLIQNSIWWIETLQLNGIRQDTYPYPDKKFMAQWAKAIMTEYPNFNIVGEEWSYNPLLVGYWQDDQDNSDGYKSYLKSTMDFPMQKAIVEGLKEEETWGTGLIKIYESLANDFHYPNPQSILIFPDNHDKSRIYTQLDENLRSTKMAVGLMLSLPRIPQIYYGTEILMDDTEKPGDHGLIRTDFPGGWPDDSVSVFEEKGLTTKQLEMKSFLSQILNFRKHSKALTQGSTIHFAPFNGVYVLFRQYHNETVMIVLNKNNSPTTINLNRFKELQLNAKRFKNVMTLQDFKWGKELKILPGISIFESL